MSDKENHDSEAPSEEQAPAATENAAPPEAGEEDAFQFEKDPEFQVEYMGECLYEVKVSIPPENERKQAQELLDELQSEAQLPGFRPGRAPRKLIEKKFGKAVRGDATEKLLSAAFQKLIKDEDLRPIDRPDIEGIEEALERGEDEPLACTFKFEVSPRCELGQYRGLELERPVLKITDEDIEAALEETRGRFAVHETVEDAKAEKDDQVIISFKGTVDGEEFQGGTADNYPYILGSGRFFAQFEEALAGAQAEQEITCQVPFPEDYSNQDLAGKTADFAITVHEIKRRQLPELDDAFAKQAGMDSMAQLRERTEENLREHVKDQSARVVEAAAIQRILEETTFELPKSMVDSAADTYYEQEVRRLMSQRMPYPEIEKREEQLRGQAREDALRGIKQHILLNEIGEAEGAEVTEEDFEKEAEAIRDRTGMEMDVISKFLTQDDQRNEYASRIFREKAMAAVIDNAKITDKEVTQEELEKEGEATEAEDAQSE